jgi:hypothetical protein
MNGSRKSLERNGLAVGSGQTGRNGATTRSGALSEICVTTCRNEVHLSATSRKWTGMVAAANAF